MLCNLCVEMHHKEFTYTKATEAVDAEQLIVKSNSYVEYQLIHMQKRNVVIINVYSPPDCPTKNLAAP